MQAQIRTLEQQVSSATIWRLFSPEDSRLVGVRYTQHAGQFPSFPFRSTRAVDRVSDKFGHGKCVILRENSKAAFCLFADNYSLAAYLRQNRAMMRNA